MPFRLALCSGSAWLTAAVLVVAACTVMPIPARAQWSPTTPCDSKPSTAEQSQCLEKALRQADAGLNTAYQRAMRIIDADPDSAPAQRAAWRHALQAAQRSWIAFRDADCGEITGYEWHQGTGMGPATLACSLDKTLQRSRELTARYASN